MPFIDYSLSPAAFEAMGDLSPRHWAVIFTLFGSVSVAVLAVGKVRYRLWIGVASVILWSGLTYKFAFAGLFALSMPMNLGLALMSLWVVVRLSDPPPRTT